MLEPLYRSATSFLATIAAVVAIMAGLYQYQNNRSTIVELPIIKELSQTYLKFSSSLSSSAFQHFYEVEEGQARFYSEKRETALRPGQLLVRSSWNGDSIMQKLSFSKSKKRQAKRFVKYIEQYKSIALRDMYLHKVPASIKLAQALLESGAGESQLARKTNNHFGIKARPGKSARAKIKARHYKQLRDEEFIPVQPAISTYRFTDDNTYDRFEVYHGVGDSYQRHTQLLTRSCKSGGKGCYAWIWQEFPVGKDHSIVDAARYHYRSSGISANDFFDGKTHLPYYAACAAGLKMAGYATSPTYHKKITYIIETYELWRFDIDLLRAIDQSLNNE